jgi:hypothetical protein
LAVGCWLISHGKTNATWSRFQCLHLLHACPLTSNQLHAGLQGEDLASNSGLVRVAAGQFLHLHTIHAQQHGECSNMSCAGMPLGSLHTVRSDSDLQTCRLRNGSSSQFNASVCICHAPHRHPEVQSGKRARYVFTTSFVRLAKEQGVLSLWRGNFPYMLRWVGHLGSCICCVTECSQAAVKP